MASIFLPKTFLKLSDALKNLGLKIELEKVNEDISVLHKHSKMPSKTGKVLQNKFETMCKPSFINLAIICSQSLKTKFKNQDYLKDALERNLSDKWSLKE